MGATSSSASARSSGRMCSSKAKRCSSATASPRRSSSGTTSRASTSRTRSWCCSPTSRPPTDPKFFDGRALTYYGRWTYKYEEALRHGARGVIIIHTTPTAELRLGCGAQLLGPRESLRETRRRREGALACGLGHRRRPARSCSGWRTTRSTSCSRPPTSRDFKPFALGIQIRGHSPSKIREIGDAQRRGDHPGQRSEAEGRGRDLQRALGPPGRRRSR